MEAEWPRGLGYRHLLVMSASRFNDDLQPLAPGDRVRLAVNVRRQNALAALLRETAAGQYLKGGPGVRIKAGASGATICVRKPIGRRASLHPFFVHRGGDVRVGTVNSVIPLIDDDPIDTGGPALTLPENGYIYLRVALTCTFEYEFYSFSEFDAEDPPQIVASTAVQTDSLTVGEGGEGNMIVYKLIATVTAGAPNQPQNTKDNLMLSICPSGINTAHAVWTGAA